MNEKIFIIWSEDNYVANRVKRILESDYDYPCFVSGSANAGKHRFSISDTVMDQMNFCDQAIVIFQDRLGGEVNSNFFFEFGFVASKYGMQKVHCVRHADAKTGFSPDMDDFFVENIACGDEETFARKIVDYFLTRQNLPMVTAGTGFLIPLQRVYADLRPLADKSLDAEQVRAAAAVSERVGDFYFKYAQYKSAYEWHTKTLEHAENVIIVSGAIADSRHLACLYEKLLEDSIGLGNALRIAEWNEKALWLRSRLVDSPVPPLQEVEKTKPIAAAVEEDSLESDPHKEDVQALDRLYGRQADIFKLIEEHSDSEDTLLEYVEQRQADDAADMSEIVGLIRDFSNTYTVSAIADNLRSLEDIIGSAAQLSDLVYSKDISVVEVKRHVKAIYEYILRNLKPFFKYDEASVLLAAFCGFLNTYLILVGNKGNSTWILNHFFYNAVFWRCPVKEIKYPALWKTIYGWVEDI